MYLRLYLRYYTHTHTHAHKHSYIKIHTLLLVKIFKKGKNDFKTSLIVFLITINFFG